jgi:hypothetical protein
MKSRFSACLLVAVILSFIGCTKEVSKENGTTTQIVNGDFYATIDGNQWNADSLQLILVSNTGVSISGLGKDGEQVTMLLPVFKTGTYALSPTSNSLAVYSNLLVNITSVFTSNTGIANGSVTISSIDTVQHLVSGTFQYTLVDPADNSQKTVTAGVFTYVPYSGNSGGGTTALADTLNASVGGVEFNSAQVVSNVTNGELFMAGISSDGTEDLALGMPQDITPGTYNMDFATGMYYGVYNVGTTITLLSQMNGSLTIISNDTVARRITGTFSFIASPLTSGSPITITSGYFSLNY